MFLRSKLINQIFQGPFQMERRQCDVHSVLLEEYTREEIASDRTPERVSQTGDSCGRVFPAQELRPLFLKRCCEKIISIPAVSVEE